MDRLNIPLFAVAMFALFLALVTELACADLLVWLTADSLNPETPGLGIRYLAIFDGLLFYTVTVMALGIIIPRSIVGRAQGVVTLVLSFFGLLGAIFMVLIAFALVILMVTLLVAVPFGTIAYMAAWGRFATDAAAFTLLLVMVLKIAFAILLALSHLLFLKNKGIIILTAVSLGMTWLVAFLHAFPPGFLVSIADAIGALVISIIGAIWLLVLLIGSIIATCKALFSGRLGDEQTTESERRSDFQAQGS